VIDRAVPPTYRELQDAATRARVTAGLTAASRDRLVRYSIRGTDAFDELDHRAIVAFDWTPARTQFVDGMPDNRPDGHFIRVRRDTLPAHVVDAYVVGCRIVDRVAMVDLAAADVALADLLLPVDERFCRGPFTALVCDAATCWVAGWY
jgi:hypothetical protein